jgi:hypothetical protein
MDVVHRLARAINDHDLESLVACFAESYRNETPAHPARGFTGRAQVRANWTRIFGSVPDLVATLRGVAGDRDVRWAEWDWRGTRTGGGPLHLVGVTVLGLADDRIAWARFYMEPVDDDPTPVAEVVRDQVGAP